MMGLTGLTSFAWAHGPLPPMDRFDSQTWPVLMKSGPRPAAYVFTTTYCSTCPDAFDQVNKAVERHAPAKSASGPRPVVAVIIMDAQDSKAVAHTHHFAAASRMYVFDGYGPSIRHAVDPQWRNVTPYIVLVDAAGKIERITGAPGADMLKTWLQP
jgi:hypothetical protein